MIDETRIVRNIKSVIEKIKKSKSWKKECIRTKDVVLMFETILDTIAESKVEQPTSAGLNIHFACIDEIHQTRRNNMKTIYRGWFISNTGELNELGNEIYKAVKGNETIYGEYKAIKKELDERLFKELQNEEE